MDHNDDPPQMKLDDEHMMRAYLKDLFIDPAKRSMAEVQEHADKVTDPPYRNIFIELGKAILKQTDEP